MSLSLIFRFVVGRYHATPYGHHVNEGLIEWPPSPWRLLRALVSVGYTHGHWDHTGPTCTGRSVIYKLASDLPRYRLPHANSAHSRHYMPIGTLDARGTECAMLVFDTWARIDGELAMIWDGVDIDETEMPLLTSLVESLNYLGRSESWVIGRVAAPSEPVLDSNCQAEQPGKNPSAGWEQVSLLSPVSASDYAAWRERELEHRAAEHYPADLLECLQADTSWMRRHGWNQPPGSRRVSYWRPPDAIAVVRHMAQRTALPRPQSAILLSLTHASHNDHVLPDVTRTLPQAELLHSKLVGTAAQMGTPPSVLTGCDKHRNPLRNSHMHAHINPLDLDGDGRLDHVLIWTAAGLGADALAAIRAVRSMPAKNSLDPLRLAPVMVGDLCDLNRLPAPYGTHASKLMAESAAWQSLTPLVLPRHIKARGRNTLVGQIKAELASRGLPEPTEIKVLRQIPTVTDGNRYQERFRHFVMSRRNGPPPPAAQGFAVRLFFDRKIAGPVAIGYGSHYGLGLFCHTSVSEHVAGGGT